jgi:hypothetical protein
MRQFCPPAFELQIPPADDVCRFRKDGHYNTSCFLLPIIKLLSPTSEPSQLCFIFFRQTGLRNCEAKMRIYNITIATILDVHKIQQNLESLILISSKRDGVNLLVVNRLGREILTTHRTWGASILNLHQTRCNASLMEGMVAFRICRPNDSFTSLVCLQANSAVIWHCLCLR